MIEKVKFDCVIIRLKKEERELLDKTLKELKLSRRKFILKVLKGLINNEINL